MSVYPDVLWATLAAVGVAATIVVPAEGPPVRVRAMLRPIFRGAVDCVRCSAFWAGALIAAPCALAHPHPAWLGVPPVSALLGWGLKVVLIDR